MLAADVWDRVTVDVMLDQRLAIVVVFVCTSMGCDKSNTATASPNSTTPSAAPTDTAPGPADELADDYGHTDTVTEAEPASTLTTENFEITVQDHMSDVLDCYAEAQATTSDLAGKLVAEFTIEADGAASAVVATSESTLDDAALLACLSGRVANWRFAPTPNAAAMTMTFPFDLAPD